MTTSGPPDNLKEATILIVDDQEANVALLEAFLADEGYAGIRSTTDSRQALPLFRSLNVDLVLLDLHMPHLDGYAVLAQLQECIPADAYVPILILTADASAEAISPARIGAGSGVSRAG